MCIRVCGTDGVRNGYTRYWVCFQTTKFSITRAESHPKTIGHINFDAKITGKRSAVKPHAAFDVAGDGNGVN